MTVDVQENSISASAGMLLKRKADGLVCGSKVYLGMTYYMGDVKLEEPIQEVPEHYEEVPDPYYYKGLTKPDIFELEQNGVIKFDIELNKYVEI